LRTNAQHCTTFGPSRVMQRSMESLVAQSSVSSTVYVDRWEAGPEFPVQLVVERTAGADLFDHASDSFKGFCVTHGCIHLATGGHWPHGRHGKHRRRMKNERLLLCKLAKPRVRKTFPLCALPAQLGGSRQDLERLILQTLLLSRLSSLSAPPE
jgi:hypothetical protein